ENDETCRHSPNVFAKRESRCLHLCNLLVVCFFLFRNIRSYAHYPKVEPVENVSSTSDEVLSAACAAPFACPLLTEEANSVIDRGSMISWATALARSSSLHVWG